MPEGIYQAWLLGYRCFGDHKEAQKNDIFKTMPTEKMPELMQDVYKTNFQDDRLYIKLQENSTGDGCVIIQFKLE